MKSEVAKIIYKLKKFKDTVKEEITAKKILKLNNRILVGTHHKTGTVWMASLFQEICKAFSLIYYTGNKRICQKGMTFFFKTTVSSTWKK